MAVLSVQFDELQDIYTFSSIPSNISVTPPKTVLSPPGDDPHSQSQTQATSDLLLVSIVFLFLENFPNKFKFRISFRNSLERHHTI